MHSDFALSVRDALCFPSLPNHAVEELLLDSKSGVFQLKQSKIRDRIALERLFAICEARKDLSASSFRTTHGMTVQLKELRSQVDPHYRRGLSYLKIGIRWLKGVLHKGCDLFNPVPLFSQDISPCFASKQAKQKYYDAI